MRHLVCCLALFGLATTALAQQGAQPQRPTTTPRVQVIDMGEGDLIEGGRQAPLGDLYTAPPQAKFKSLIKVRTNFDDKIAQSFDEL